MKSRGPRTSPHFGEYLHLLVCHIVNLAQLLVLDERTQRRLRPHGGVKKRGLQPIVE